jgi:hypothetical protein
MDRTLNDRPIPFWILAGMLILLVGTGCTTLTSTMLHRKEDEQFVKNRHKPFKGLPMTMQVPTHLDVWVRETYFLTNTPEGYREVDLNGQRFFDIETVPVKTKKVFVVDFKRPGAGSLKYSLGFNDEQYLNKIANKIEDQTLQDIADAVQTVSPVLGGLPTKTAGKLSSRLTEATRDVAFRRFDLDRPTFELELNDFVAQAISQCTNPPDPLDPIPDFENGHHSIDAE